MKRFARLLVVTVGFGALGFVMSLVPQKNATGAGGAPVTVINTSTNPVPVTGNVNAAVSGTVAAQQSGNWNVGLAPDTTVGISGSVPIVNPVGNNSTPIPLGVRDTDNPARQPFVAGCAMSSINPASESCGANPNSTHIIVPATQELVIEFVEARMDFLSPGRPLALNINFTTNSRSFQLQYPAIDAGPESGFLGELFLVNSPTRIYADPGSTIDCVGSNSQNAEGLYGTFTRGTCAVTGYLINP